MCKVQEKSDKVRASIEQMCDEWDKLKTEFLVFGISEKDLQGIKNVQKWLLRTNADARDLSEHVQKI